MYLRLDNLFVVVYMLAKQFKEKNEKFSDDHINNSKIQKIGNTPMWVAIVSILIILWLIYACGNSSNNEMMIRQYMRILIDSLEIINKSKNLGTKISRCELAIEQCNKILAIKYKEDIIEQKQEIERKLTQMLIEKRVENLRKILKNAEKYEFKTEDKKALGYYQDALFEIKTNDITQDELEKANIKNQINDNSYSMASIEKIITEMKIKLSK